MNIETNQNKVQGTVTLADLLETIWAEKLAIGIVTVALTLVVLVVVLLLPNRYLATAVLIPASSSSNTSLSKLAGQFGGLAALAGVNLGGDGSSNKTAIALEVVKSRDFINSFVKRRDISVDLIAANGWDRSTNKLRYDSGWYDEKAGKWVREASPPYTEKPTDLEIYERFREILSVSMDKKSGVVTVSIQFYSPVLAKQWVDWLIEDLNSHTRMEDIREARESINYLQDQITKTNVVDIKTSLYQLIEEQVKTLMLAEVREEYVFKTIDKAYEPDKKNSPKRAMILVLTVFIGLFIGLLWALIKNFFLPFGRSKG